jgi:hypothetical protein
MIYLIYFRCRLYATYNLNYAPTTFGVQSWRENISGGTRKKKVEDHWFRERRVSGMNLWVVLDVRVAS